MRESCNSQLSQSLNTSEFTELKGGLTTIKESKLKQPSYRANLNGL